MTTPVSDARGCVWGGIKPPGAKSALIMESPRVFSPGNDWTSAKAKRTPVPIFTLPSLISPSKKKSSEVTCDLGLHG
ncbi:hypothetical protein TorRG33x02_181750 [Trema orientale]|uniref:Uncharacterized protein n=2 Tax=Cannabaceae TaxID=3481 RepID=A0A2P5CIZ5_PARAD|nr:hypothetical protein PanWU01x14_148060 [Parasponia andersonii]PON86125.1 hypothetical protein TorRG33x02_181750 [Trema orientale]